MDFTIAEAGAWLLALGGGAGAATAVVALGLKLWRFARRIGHFLDDVGGEPGRPGVEARPGIMERLAGIEHEVQRNDGTSLKDSVARTESQVRTLTSDVDQLRNQVNQLRN